MRFISHPILAMSTITFVALLFVVFVGLWFGHFTGVGLSLTESGHALGEFNVSAVSLLRTGTFNNGGPGFETNMLRGPGYVAVLAGSLLLFGEKLGVIYILNLLFFLLSIWLLWRISIHFLSGDWVFLPPLMFALFWGFSSHVWNRNYEFYVLFFALLSLKGFLRYYDTRSPLWLAMGAAAYGLWILEKPIMLYSIPALLFLILFWHWHAFEKKECVSHAVVFLLVLISVVGPWMARNRIAFDTFQLGTGGHSVLRRSTQVDYPFSHLFSLALSFSLGDFIGSKLYAGYPADGKPAAWDPAVESRWYQQGWHIKEPDGTIITRLELDRRMYKEAFANIMRRPFKFLLTSPLGLLRLNAPVDHGGREIMHLFWGQNPFLSDTAKIIIILAIRLVWFAFLGIVFWMFIRHLPFWHTQWGLLLFFVFYFNIMYGMLTHAEARYIFTMMPFYFILFAEGVRRILKKFKKEKMQESI